MYENIRRKLGVKVPVVQPTGTQVSNPEYRCKDEKKRTLSLCVAVFLTCGCVMVSARLSAGVVGVLGNLLNVAVLSCRYFRRDDDTMEKVALTGLISLGEQRQKTQVIKHPWLSRHSPLGQGPARPVKSLKESMNSTIIPSSTSSNYDLENLIPLERSRNISFCDDQRTFPPRPGFPWVFFTCLRPS